MSAEQEAESVQAVRESAFAAEKAVVVAALELAWVAVWADLLVQILSLEVRCLSADLEVEVLD